MTSRTLRIQLAGERRTRFIVAGARGAVEYQRATINGGPIDIQYHSPRPWPGGYDPVLHRCNVLEGPCYLEFTYPEALDVHQKYTAAMNDEEAIWQELEQRHAAWARGELVGERGKGR